MNERYSTPAGDSLILIRIGEIALKGLNRSNFERQLISNMRYRLRDIGRFTFTRSQSRIWLEARDGKMDVEAVLARIGDVFGYVSASPVVRFSLDMDLLRKHALANCGQWLADGKQATFKFETKRVNKQFGESSHQISADLGQLLLETWPDQLTVDVHNPDRTFYVEIRDAIYLYTEIYPAYKGLPVGMSGKGMLLLSGGIDSPVAGFRMASRGMMLDAVYFHTFPYTSDEAKRKVIDLARILSRYAGTIKLNIVDFTDVQLTLNEACPPAMLTIVMRRMMMRIAERLAEEQGCKCLITGESLGQVASQTLEALVTTDRVVSMPVFRPLIGLDKDEVIALARRVGTFETSILPYEDCCTVFIAKHPKTHPSLADAEAAEEAIDPAELVEHALARIELLSIKPHNEQSI